MNEPIVDPSLTAESPPDEHWTPPPEDKIRPLAVKIGSLQTPPKDDPAELLRYRWLCRGGSLLIPGPTGSGKSSFVLQAAALWANNLPFMGIHPTHTLSALYVQAENDEGDVADIRDGICTGAGLSKEQRECFFDCVLVHTSNGITGKNFCWDVLAPLLEDNPVDLLIIDPILSFLGGDMNKQEVVGNFLRVFLQPIIAQFKIAVIIIHHCNKPLRTKEALAMRNGDFSYMGAGSAEWANWARAVLAFDSTGNPGEYTLHPGKRGSKLGWKNPDDTPAYEKSIAWNRKSKAIWWSESTPISHLPGGRPSKNWPDRILSAILLSPRQTSDWLKTCQNDCGIPRRSFFDAKDSLLEKGKIILTEKGWTPVVSQSSNPASADP